MPPDEKFEVFCVYIKVVKQCYGALRTREIYQKAINCLPESRVVDMCIQYSDMERALGEIERARSILVHASKFCKNRGQDGAADTASTVPGDDPDLWTHWHAFEVAHGNEDTFRDMLRIRRSGRYTR